MILTLLFITMVIVGVILIVIDVKGIVMPLTREVGVPIVIIGLILLITSLTLIILEHTTTNYVIYRNKIQYDSLCKRCKVIDSEYEDISKLDTIKDIEAWNVSVYTYKCCLRNPWTNWYCSQKIADNLEYIPLE